MDWVIRTFSSSVGKKYLMALTGLGFLSFLAGHLAGNLSIYLGPEAFTSYAEHLHALGPLVTAAEGGLIVFAIIHVTTGLTLFYQNYRARPVRYSQKNRAGGRTWSSATMPYSGLLVLAFVSLHLMTFRFIPHTPDQTFGLVVEVFHNPAYLVIYMASMVVLAFHVRHGLWSAFQTLGLNHPQYMPAIEKLSLAFAALVAVGFGLLPVVFLFSA